ncbi:MAG: nitrilase-related carbon-nitrogen hydrolase [Nitrospirales bacterium]|nr:nitrilase-related carbon-nitrogen hydrolase [Nitrospirales bacterium]
MKVGFFQFSPIFGEIHQNLDSVLKTIPRFSGELLVFPELALSGYQFVSMAEVEELSQEIPGSPIFQQVEEMVRRHSLHVVIGLAERFQGRIYNSAILLGPNGYVGTYRKTHLFLEETRWFVPGNTGFRVWDIGMAKVGLLVCFDWLYPEAARTLALKGADILCHPSNLVLPYCPDAMVTRCLENRVYAITANRVGREERGQKPPLRFIGMSEIVDPSGRVLYRASQEHSELYECEIDVSQARDKRMNPYNDLLRDRRPEWYRMQ